MPQFTNSIGVLKHSEVDYLGVPVGEVSAVTRVPGGVNVKMSIQKTQRLPHGRDRGPGPQVGHRRAVHRLRAARGLPRQQGSVLSSRLHRAHGARSGPPQTGATPTVPLEFTDLLRSANTLFVAIPPDALSNLLHEAAIGLNGRTDSLRQLTEGGDKLSAELVTRTQAINQLITNNTRLTHVVTDHRQSFGQSLSDLSQIAATLQQAQGDTSRLLDKGAPLLQHTADIVAAEKGNLDCSLKSLGQLIDVTTTPRKEQELTTLLNVGPTAFGDAWDSIDFGPGPTGTNYSGPWVRVGIINNSNNPAPAYIPPKAHADPAAGRPRARRRCGPIRPTTGRPTSAPCPHEPGRCPRPPADIVIGLCLALAAMAVLRRRAFARPVRIQ